MAWQTVENYDKGELTMEWISVKDRLPDEEQDVLLLIREIEFYGRHLEKKTRLS